MPRKLTTEEFIIRATKKHGGKYDYSKSVYIHFQKKIIILCKEHGEFIQTPESHLRYGCSFCSERKIYTTEIFIKKANEIHNNKYDYSKSIYKNYVEKIIITCKIHGDFLQKPNNHLYGNGCSKCAGKIKNTEEFIKRVNNIKEHFNKGYNYTNFIYINYDTKGKIECPIHGIFEMSPDKHLSQKMGCPKCTKEKAIKATIKPIEEFIKEANKIHINKYDYSVTNYINSKTIINVFCPTEGHGIFNVTPDHHLRYSGCPKCYKESKKQKVQQKIFEVHGNTYKYPNFYFKNLKSKIVIECQKHGEFKQVLNEHIHKGSGCPYCTRFKGEIIITNFLIDNNIKFETQKKFQDCFDIKLLRFDFYLPQHNTCIEYDGKHHFESINFFGGEKHLIDTKKKDYIKNEYCTNNKISLLRIKYTDNIYEKLKLTIKK